MKVTNDYFEKLRKKFILTDMTIDSFRYSIDGLILHGYLDKHYVNIHNELMFSSNPLYIHRTFEDIKLLEIIFDLLDSDNFESFDEFNSFIDFIYCNESYKEMKSCFENLFICGRIMAVEGKLATYFSDKYKAKADIIYDNIRLSKKNMAQLYEKFPNKQSLYNGSAICSMIDFLNEKIDESYLLFKNDVIKHSPNFKISTIDKYKNKDEFEPFCISISEYSKVFSNIKKEVK